MMRLKISILILFNLLFVQASLSQEQYHAEIIRYDGSVEILKKGERVWQKLKKEGLLYEGDKIRTLSLSNVDLRLSEDSLLRLKENTTFRLTELNKKDSIILLDLEFGKVLANIRRLKSHSTFKVRTPVAVAGARGTNFFIYSENQRETTVGVSSGELVVESLDFPREKVTLVKGKKLIVTKGVSPSEPEDIRDTQDIKSLKESYIIGKKDIFKDEVSIKVQKNERLNAVLDFKTIIDKDMFDFKVPELDLLKIVPKQHCIHNTKELIKPEKGLIKDIKIAYKGPIIEESYRAIDYIEIKFTARPVGRIIEDYDFFRLEMKKAYKTKVNVLEGVVYLVELDMFGRLTERRVELTAIEEIETKPEIPTEGEEPTEEPPQEPSKGISTWNLASTAGFGDSTNITTSSMIAFKGTASYTYLYAGTTNSAGKADLYRSTTPVSTDSWEEATPSSLGNEHSAIMCFALDKPVDATKIFLGTGVATGAPLPGEVWRSTTDGSSASWSKISFVGNHWQVDYSDGAPDAPSVTTLAVVGDYVYVGASFNRHNAEIWRINTASGDTFEQILTKEDVGDSTMTQGSNYGRVAFIRYHSPYIYIGFSPVSGTAGTVVIRSTFTASNQDSIQISDSTQRLSNWTRVSRLN